MNKSDKLRAWLRSGRSVTGKLAWKRWGLYRLSGTIFRLKKELPITCTMVRRKGEVFAKYSLIDREATELKASL